MVWRTKRKTEERVTFEKCQWRALDGSECESEVEVCDVERTMNRRNRKVKPKHAFKRNIYLLVELTCGAKAT